jgi:hypothetical protein
MKPRNCGKALDIRALRRDMHGGNASPTSSMSCACCGLSGTVSTHQGCDIHALISAAPRPGSGVLSEWARAGRLRDGN